MFDYERALLLWQTLGSAGTVEIEGYMTVAVLGLLGLVVGGTALVAWLKGTLGLVPWTVRELRTRRGDVRAWMALFVPGESVVVMFFSAAWQLARPDSRWARWFYSARKMDRARAVHG